MLWTPKEIAYIVEEYFIGQRSIIVAQRKFRQRFGKQEALSRKVILRAVTNFRMTGDASKRKSPGRHRTSRNAENCGGVKKAITQSPSKSTRRLAQQVNIPRTSVNRILKQDLRLYPYKVQVVQQLLPADKLQRKTFAEWVNNICREEEYFTQHLITSDEAHFDLSGYVNKQNCRFWGRKGPEIMHEKPLHT